MSSQYFNLKLFDPKNEIIYYSKVRKYTKARMSVEKEKLRLGHFCQVSGFLFKSEDASFDLARILKCALQADKKSN